MQSPPKSQWHFFKEIEQKSIRFIWRHKRPQVAEKKRTKPEVSHSLPFPKGKGKTNKQIGNTVITRYS